MTDKEKAALKQELIIEIVNLLWTAQETNKRGPIYAVQPTSSIAELAAEAAADVLLAFEIGYRMNETGETK